MKKFLLFAALLCCVNAFAQDVILKKDGSEIKAKVLEITDQQVKYKDFDLLVGPTRNIDLTEVFMITYENGQKEVFNKQTQPAVPTTRGRNYNTPSTDLKAEFDRIGTDDDKMLEFFRKNNFTSYYDDFESACRQRRAGKGLLGAGLGLTGGGIVFMTVGLIIWEPGFYIAGYALTGMGEVFVIVSIPVSASAGGKKKAIKNDFARKNFGVDGYTYQPKLNFGLTSNGVGLTLNF
ncbi:MAG: hypothetical protein LBN95_02215 [Prevotellaceae bacterium]|jgi:hypothetical protein|nr:hypothetical protein [Prevotellaceae bacterium]